MLVMFTLDYPYSCSALTRSLFTEQCLFLLWCMAPVSWNGSQILYRHVVRPFFLKHEAAVDGMVNNLGGKAMTVAESATREGK